MKFTTIFTIATLAVASFASAERAHQLKARVNAENGIEKRGHGKLTWYAGGMLDAPACGGPTPGDDDLVLAVKSDGSYGKCGDEVELHYQGKSVRAKVRDYCEDCEFGHFDGTKGVFKKLADLEKGILTGITYKLL
jgi:hypothetical protein